MATNGGVATLDHTYDAITPFGLTRYTSTDSDFAPHTTKHWYDTVQLPKQYSFTDLPEQLSYTDLTKQFSVDSAMYHDNIGTLPTLLTPQHSTGVVQDTVEQYALGDESENSPFAELDSPYVEDTADADEDAADEDASETVSTKRAAAARPKRARKRKSSDTDSVTATVVTNDSNSSGGGSYAYVKRLKHQQTDRVRRARIKEHMDSLKSLVIPKNTAKVDQDTVIVASVNTITQLQQKLAAAVKENKTLKTQNKQVQPYTAPPTAASSIPTPWMSILSAVNVAVWRTSLDHRILEVNSMFQQHSGHAVNDAVGSYACSAPFYGQLAVKPAVVLREIEAVKHQFNVLSTDCCTEDMLECDSALTQYDHEALHNNVYSTPITRDREYVTLPCRHYSQQNSLSKALLNLPPNYVLQGIARCKHRSGKILSGIVSVQLIRNSDGTPAYFVKACNMKG